MEATYVQNKKVSHLAGKDEVKLPQPPASGTSRVNVGDTERIISTILGLVFTFFGFRKGSWLGILSSLSGLVLLYRGGSGYCPVNQKLNREEKLEKSPLILASRAMTIGRSPAEVYQFWRNLENLPLFMKHVKNVRQLSETQSHWTVVFPRFKQELSWTAEIVDDEPNRRISYRSLPGAKLDNSGEVFLREAPGGRGTEIKVTLSYRPPQGMMGKQVARLFNDAFEQMVQNDLHRLKQHLETGEVVSTDGQPAAR